MFFHPFLRVAHHRHHGFQILARKTAVGTSGTGLALIFNVAGVEVLKHHGQVILARSAKSVIVMILTIEMNHFFSHHFFNRGVVVHRVLLLVWNIVICQS